METENGKRKKEKERKGLTPVNSIDEHEQAHLPGLANPTEARS